MGKKAEEEEGLVYTILRNRGVPLRLVSTVDLCKQWEDALEERTKKNDWWRPIRFVDADGKTVIVMACNCIEGIVQGIVPGSTAAGA
jgi:hypothetical protein